MNIYRFESTDEHGNPHRGTIEAENPETARRLLAAQGMSEIVTLEEVEDAQRPLILTRYESDEVLRYVSQLGVSDLPLAAGLRAAAEEVGSQRVARALSRLARQLEKGMSLEEIVASPDSPLPRWAASSMSAAARCGHLGAALLELVRHQQSTLKARRMITRALAYPVLVAFLAFVIFLPGLYLVCTPYKQLYEEFELQLPFSTLFLFWWRDVGFPILAAMGLGIAILFCVVRLLSSKETWSWLMSGIPIFGSMWHWAGIAEWSGLLRVLLRYEIPLPEALRLAGEGVGNAEIGGMSYRLAEGIEAGLPLVKMSDVPASLLPLLRWGEASGRLSEAFAASGEYFERRVQMRALALRVTLPALLFIVIGCCVLFALVAMGSPLIGLIQGLS